MNIVKDKNNVFTENGIERIVTNNPLVSIITVTYNVVNSIEATIKSVINQSQFNFEYIIIDGNSTDGTQSIVEKYINNIDVWISEPDKGIADALNKGVKYAKGKYVLCILSGDILYDIPTDTLVKENSDLVCFPVKVTGNFVVYPKINNWLKIKNTIPHQGAFFKRTDKLIHNNKYRFFCDFALTQLLYKTKSKINIYSTPVIAFHGLDGATSNISNSKEMFTVINDNYGPIFKLLSFLYWKFYGLMKRLKIKAI